MGKQKYDDCFVTKKSNNDDFSPKETVETYRISVSIKYLLFAHVFKRLAQKLGGFSKPKTRCPKRITFIQPLNRLVCYLKRFPMHSRGLNETYPSNPLTLFRSIVAKSLSMIESGRPSILHLHFLHYYFMQGIF